MEFVIGQLGAAIEIEPLDAALKAVELAYGAVEYWRVELHEAALAECDATRRRWRAAAWR
jgi:hypothetical protein